MRLLLTADPELPVPPKLYGGIERIVDLLVERLRARGHAVGLVAHAESTCQADAFYPWPGVSSRSRMDTVRNLQTLRRAAHAFRPDVLHSFSRIMYMGPIIRWSLPKIMSYQRAPSGRTVPWANRLGRGTLTFTGCSEYICGLGRPHGGAWTAIHNGVDLRRFDFAPSVPDDAPIVFLSRIERIKGAHTAIEIARRAGRRLLLAGNHAMEGEAGRYWREQIEPRFADGSVEYAGPVDDAQKNDLLGRAAAMLVPIEWEEPFGIVFAEALACGTPVISTPRGALPEIVRSGREGFLVGGIDDGVEAVRRLATIDRAACRARAEAHFAADVIVGRYEALYEARLRGESRLPPLDEDACGETAVAGSNS